jgi:hypothetical protein
MNYIISIFALIALLTTNPAFAGGETKEVCEPAKDKAGKVIKNKDGSDKQNCKKIKVHKKVEGDKVPEKK